MIQIGYTHCEYDCYVYVKMLDDGSYIFLLLYVDDMLIATKSMCEVDRLKALLRKEFETWVLLRKFWVWRFARIKSQESCGYLRRTILEKFLKNSTCKMLSP